MADPEPRPGLCANTVDSHNRFAPKPRGSSLLGLASQLLVVKHHPAEYQPVLGEWLAVRARLLAIAAQIENSSRAYEVTDRLN